MIKDKNFKNLFIANIISSAGDVFQDFAIMWYVLNRTNSTIWASLSLVLNFLPKIIFGTYAGVLADSKNKKNIIIKADILNGIFCILLMISVIENLAIPYILIITFIMSSLDIITQTSEMSFLPELINEDNLLRANSFMNGTESMVSIVGPGLAGLLYALMGAKYLFLFNGVSFFVACIFMKMIKYTFINKKNESLGVEGLSKQKSDYLQGFKEIFRDSNLRTFCIFGGGIINFFISPTTIYISKYILNQNISQGILFGMLTSAIALGTLLSSLFLSNFKKEVDEKKIIVLGFFGEAITMFMFAKFSNYVYNLICIILLGFSMGVIGINLQTYIQRVVSLEVLGRSMSTIMLVSNIAVPLGLLSAGIVTEKFQLSSITSFIGVSMFIISLIVLYRIKTNSN
ncbi:MFS transporter [Finegoldia sp. BIOML-A2]|uniref:MFS transporter n=1 Tax=Finegoldia TaxID=150022 RepID=UPI0012AF7754|nr:MULTISPECIES: MFS transporter [Finegoldia]MBS5971268.1 MFS transporter [Finegoldia magna]MCC2717603.1 MFS transporter [Finegoldia magna]MDU2500630.1 MFS transporter [Finegoldia magna]MDU4333947.1 MFS transporter [Finegoldia magna]MSA97292.1 MFS transporter [Finegoldia sp. BIOML-A5]